MVATKLVEVSGREELNQPKSSRGGGPRVPDDGEENLPALSPRRLAGQPRQKFRRNVPACDDARQIGFGCPGVASQRAENGGLAIIAERRDDPAAG